MPTKQGIHFERHCLCDSHSSFRITCVITIYDRHACMRRLESSTNLIAPSIYELVPVDNSVNICMLHYTHYIECSPTCGWSLAKKMNKYKRNCCQDEFQSFTLTILFCKRLCTQCDGHSASFMWYDYGCHCCQHQCMDNHTHNNRLNQFARTAKKNNKATAAASSKESKKHGSTVCHVIYYILQAFFFQPLSQAKPTTAPTQTDHLICTVFSLFTFNYDAKW